MEKFNLAKNFKVTKNFTLAREFFKPLVHLTDNDLKIIVQHLLGRTPNREWLYPKVTVDTTSKVHYLYYSAAEWVDWRKKKMIVLQELNNIDRTLEVVTAEGMVDNEKWRSRKRSYYVSSAVWNVLLTIIPVLRLSRLLGPVQALLRLWFRLQYQSRLILLLSHPVAFRTPYSMRQGRPPIRMLSLSNRRLDGSN
jgi:hypothetical protein